MKQDLIDFIIDYEIKVEGLSFSTEDSGLRSCGRQRWMIGVVKMRRKAVVGGSDSGGRWPFKRFVEIGRVALVNYGEDYGRLVVIVDVIDQNRALVDAPDMVRCQMNFKRLTLTDITIKIKRIPKKKTLIEAMEAADVKNKWENSSWGRKLIVQKRRAALTDFDRFKLMLAKIKRAGLVRQELAQLKKQTTT
ncbi:LOW QUALITY PROTEIN: hypothetical protein RJ639_005754 [Escallonia herrerae]|uniref:Large ribosomal subunit protein eL14 domain-containing protein n=1 Tax=Escallonia herrerae TaxID=1293975 RepID=A0AA88VXC8_9ASTE|nr:LOW QUALITY PROTEIN: hypothetical protein RJ639_005754 [Escallonia herrerae]